jgi:hypothetical protein
MTNRKLLACAFAALGLISTPVLATAADRLTDKEVEELFDRIETNRSEFEAALDDKLKNSTISGPRGQVNTNEFFDDLEDQVQRTRDRFKDDYSASSEVSSLLGYATRLQAWASTQPSKFQGHQEWEVLDKDFHRLAAAYNTSLPQPQQANARRVNDEELVAAVASAQKRIAAFQTAYSETLAVGTSLTPETKQSATKQVETMKNDAKQLSDELAGKQKGISQAEKLMKESAMVAQTASKLPANSPSAAAWTPLGAELTTIALAYEMKPLTK